ncbi:hypothetical protein J6590_031827 [Homalodisca vitripennis]|nr:hypothetical protein J6590_031827 [Homalodisca vitripennis]
MTVNEPCIAIAEGIKWKQSPKKQLSVFKRAGSSLRRGEGVNGITLLKNNRRRPGAISGTSTEDKCFESKWVAAAGEWRAGVREQQASKHAASEQDSDTLTECRAVFYKSNSKILKRIQYNSLCRGRGKVRGQFRQGTSHVPPFQPRLRHHRRAALATTPDRPLCR